MLAKTLAELLEAYGANVVKFTEGDDLVDGEVEISDTVHVQVPTHGGLPGVVEEREDSTFFFYPERNSIKALLDDIREASK